MVALWELLGKKKKKKWYFILKPQSYALVTWRVLTHIAFCVLKRFMEINYIWFHCIPFFSICQPSYPLLLWYREIEFHFWLIALLFLFVLIIVPDHLQRNHMASTEADVRHFCSFPSPPPSHSPITSSISYFLYFLLPSPSGIFF